MNDTTPSYPWKEYFAKYYQKNKSKRKDMSKRYYEAHRVEQIEKAKARYKNNRSQHLARKYGVSAEEISKLNETQKVCQICGATEKLNIDHCHTTKKVRGMLCRGCNTGIGCFTEDSSKLMAAVEYLKRYST